MFKNSPSICYVFFAIVIDGRNCDAS